jgi:hypothetical protein
MYPAKPLVILAVLFISMPYAAAQPPFPYYLEGHAFLDGKPIPSGTAVTAADPDGTICEFCNFTTADETGWYVLVISGDDISTPEDEGALDNDTITFFIGGIQAEQTLVWHSGESDYDFNLTATTPCNIETFGLHISAGSIGHLPDSTIYIFGYLLNSSCQPVPDADIFLTIQNSSETVFSTSIITNATGEFLFPYGLSNLSSGNYSISASYENITASTAFVITECVDSDSDNYNQSNEFYDCGPADCDDSDPEVNPGTDELCDGKDNNCNGETDEGFNIGEPCSAGTGACYAEGEYVCTPDRSGTGCSAVPGTPASEICDGIDNDCDGETDEGLECGRQSGGGAGGSSGGTYIPTCDEHWTCTGWSECLNGSRTRVCQDASSCGTERGRPEEVQNCTVSAVKGETIICSSGARVCVNSQLKECVNGVKWETVQQCESGCGQDRCKKPAELNATRPETGITGAAAFDPTPIYIGIAAFVMLSVFVLFRKLR